MNGSTTIAALMANTMSGEKRMKEKSPWKWNECVNTKTLYVKFSRALN